MSISHKGILVSHFFSNHQNILNALKITKVTTFFWDQSQIDNMILKARKRDFCPIEKKYGQPLKSMSNGEQKKTLLHYLIAQHPKILIIQDLYAHLDILSIKEILQVLNHLKTTTKIIQIEQHRQHLLPFINEITTTHHCVKSKPTSLNEIPKSTIFYPSYNTLIKLQGIDVSYGDKKVLCDINWEIKPNTLWQLYGKNGSGKTTLLSLITGDNPKAYGQKITLFDQEQGDQSIWNIKQKIGYCTPDITCLFDRRHSVLEMLISGFFDSIGLYKKPTELQIHIAKKWLGFIEMKKMANKTFLSLTLGEQRMILVARAMIKRPPLLLLDEPTIGLNPVQKDKVIQLINHFAKNTNSSIVYVSHTPLDGIDTTLNYQLEHHPTKGSKGKIL